MLKKEAMKTQSRELEKGAEYRQMLVQVGRGAWRLAGAAGQALWRVGERRQAGRGWLLLLLQQAPAVLRAVHLCPTPQAIHTCAVRYPDVAASVLHLLCDFLSDTNTASALDVIFFIREIIQVRAVVCWLGWTGHEGWISSCPALP